MDVFKNIRGILSNKRVSLGKGVEKVDMIVGSGNPNSNILADKASIYHRVDGVSDNEYIYIKTTNSSNTGWITIGANESSVYEKHITKEVGYDNLVITKSGSRVIKTAYCMFTENHKPSPDFTQVYENNVLLTFGTNWTWGAATTGTVDSLVDNIIITSPNPGSVYRLEHLEKVVLYQPEIRMFHEDADNKNKRITSRLHTKHDDIYRIVWQYEKLDDWSYNITYRQINGSDPMIIPKTFSNRIRFKEFGVNESLSPWRLEIMRTGKNRSSGSGVTSPGAKTDLIPYYINDSNLYTLLPKKTGDFYFRLRNIDTNTVTNYSLRHLSVRRLGIWQPNPSGDIFIGIYWMPEII